MADTPESKLGDLLKKAVSLGAGAYVSAEDRITKTLNTVQAPIQISREMMAELLQKFLESYTLSIKAEIDFVPKKKKSKEGDSK
jgi:hypothetical protein